MSPERARLILRNGRPAAGQPFLIFYGRRLYTRHALQLVARSPGPLKVRHGAPKLVKTNRGQRSGKQERRA